MLSRRIQILGLGLVASTVLSLGMMSNADDKVQPPSSAKSNHVPLKTFMRKKLTASQNILEGLAAENFELIESASRELNEMSSTEKFMASNDPLYFQYVGQFRRIVQQMEKSAKDRNLDGATLAFVNMTSSCVECHKFVRTIQLAQ